MSLAMRKSSACARRQTQDRPNLNLYDIPEMMVGAQPSANSVERERFNQRCRTLWEEDGEQETSVQGVCHFAQENNAANRYSQLEKMFPDLDPDLVWSICQETANMQQIVDMLLALSVSISEDVGSSGGSVAADQPSKAQCEAVPQKDGGAWPALLDNDGWEIVSYQALQQQEQDLGSTWCKTAKDAAHLPAPKPSRNEAVQTKEKQKQSRNVADTTNDVAEDAVPTDYEMRHMRGQMRATKLAAKSISRGGNRDCGNAGQENEQLVSESGDSVDTVPEICDC